MNINPDARKSEQSKPLTEIFIRRWQAGDKSCVVKAPGILITTPYPGLRSFRHELNRYFCGREIQKKDLKRFFTNRETDGSASSSRMTFVVGGSGSGKSSLTRAGLIAELDSIPIRKEWGAWYVAEMRPGKTPIARLQNALWNVLQPLIEQVFVDPTLVPESVGSFPQRPTEEKLQSHREASARIRAKALQLGVDWPEGARMDSVEQAVRRWLNREISPSRGEISSSALFDFVDDVLAGFDAAASFGSRGGSPLLLLHIDQFEEIFRKECDADGRAALIATLRDIHVYKPERLFAVATMRSEELHRFSEFTGMADVINASMYLVDLVGADDIGTAIVEPAWRLADLWELPLDTSSASRVAPYTIEAVEELKEAYWEAGEAIQHKADKLPLLQHFLPLAWGRAVDDWIERRSRDQDAIFKIDVRHLESVPGWRSDDHYADTCRLGRCLNAAADRVFAEAKGEMNPVLKNEDNILDDKNYKFTATTKKELEFEAEGVLLVALCSLAQLDDGGQAVRKFVSIDDMLRATGAAARLGKSEMSRKALHLYLCKALKKFEEAGLVELLPAEESGELEFYNVTHESLIRNWAYYKDQLDEKKRLENRLWQLASGGFELPDKERMPWLDKKLHRDWEAANTIIQAESQETLSMLFAPRSLYSKDWAVKFLIERKEQLEATGQNTKGNLDEKRIDKIGAAWRDAVAWKEWGETWYSKVQTYAMWAAGGIVTLLCLAVAASLFATFYYFQAAESATKAQQLTRQLNYALAVSDITSPKAERTSMHDRALTWLVEKVHFEYNNGEFDSRQRAVTRRTIGNIDKGARAIYGSDMAVQFEAQPLQGDSESAVCVKADSAGTKKLQVVAGTAQWMSASDPNAPSDSGIAIALDDGVLCASRDGAWVLQLGTINKQTFIGMQHLNIPTPMPIRWPAATENVNRMGQMVSDAGYLKRLSSLKVDSIKFVHSGAIVGFMVPELGPIENGKPSNVYLWSTTGLSDPVPMTPKEEVGPVSSVCKYETLKRATEIGGDDQQCIVGRIKLDADDKRLVIRRPVSDEEECKDDLAPCKNTIEIQYMDAAITQVENSDKPIIRTSLIHYGSKIMYAGVVGDWLWIEDVNKQKWRYLVGIEPLKYILALRWRDTEWKTKEKPFGIEYRLPDMCEELKECRSFLEKKELHWPGGG